jgi:hypothetical protein
MFLRVSRGVKSCKSPDTYQTPSELVQAGGEKLRSGTYKLVNSIWSKKELSVQWNESIIMPVF